MAAPAEPVTPRPDRLPLPTSLFGRPVFYGWYIVALALVASMMSSGVQAYGLGVFVTPMTEELGWSRTDISLGQTLSTAVMGVIGLLIGGLIDRRGGRELIVFGAVLSGLGYMVLGQVQELWQYYAVKAGLLTLGMAMMGSMVLNVAVSNWFIRYRGRAIAITAMGNSVAAMILPTLAARLIDGFGWRTAWVLIGASIWVLVIPPAWLIMRRRPEDHGLEPDGGRVEARPGDARAVQRAAVDGVRWTRRQAMRTPALWLLIATFGLGGMGFSAMLLHLIPYLTDAGYSRGQAAAAFSMIGVAGLISKPIWGLIVERVAARFAAAAEFFILGIGVILILNAGSLPMMYAAILVFGVGIGGVITVQEVVWADYYGRLTLGTVRSIGRPFTIVSSAGGPVFAGLAYDIGGSYDLAFISFIVAYVFAAVLILLTPTPRPPVDATIEEIRPIAPAAAPGG
ncbi:MAG: MFS transporter [Chloroflexi bacterium]|nr:MFS transporter [Chloroflexota bacterium]MDA1240364.1 MFS transporter [Chloroflexota bacterium]